MRRFIHIIFILFLFSTSVWAQDNILSRIDKTVGVTLPAGYGEKVAAYLNGNVALKNTDALAYTEQFITEQMKKDWGINRQNQYLFVWYAIIEQVAGEDLYDGEDRDDARLDDFETAVELVDESGKVYADGIMAYMEGISEDARRQAAEYDRRIAEAQRQSAEFERQTTEAQRQSAEFERQTTEAQRQSAEFERQTAEAQRQSAEFRVETLNITIDRLKLLEEFYGLWVKAPNTITDSEIQSRKDVAKHVLENCRKYYIDYKQYLSEGAMKFYGIE